MIGVRGIDVEEQFDFVESCCTEENIARLRRGDVFARACAANGEPGFSPIDADFLDGFIRSVRPGKIVQVGCGVSTALILNAAAELPDYTPEVVCVEPYPTDFLTSAGQSGLVRLVAEKAQSVAIEELTRLGDNGFLFIDSTHTVKPGSEVNRLILEVLPRLESGSWVHFHDIYFPYDYQRGLLDDELFFSNESALLHAFLIDNSKFTVRTSLSMLHHADPARLGDELTYVVNVENNGRADEQDVEIEVVLPPGTTLARQLPDVASQQGNTIRCKPIAVLGAARNAPDRWRTPGAQVHLRLQRRQPARRRHGQSGAALGQRRNDVDFPRRGRAASPQRVRPHGHGPSWLAPRRRTARAAEHALDVSARLQPGTQPGRAPVGGATRRLLRKPRVQGPRPRRASAHRRSGRAGIQPTPDSLNDRVRVDYFYIFERELV